jgi:hypothetical protein
VNIPHCSIAPMFIMSFAGNIHAISIAVCFHCYLTYYFID